MGAPVEPGPPGWSGRPVQGMPPQAPRSPYGPPTGPQPPGSAVPPRPPVYAPAQQWRPSWPQTVPPPPPAPAAARPPRRRTLPALVWSLALVAALLVVGSRGVGAASTTSATAMVGSDGAVAWYTDGTSSGGVVSGTWARATGGLGLASSGPDALGVWLVNTSLDIRSAPLARFSWTGDNRGGDEVFSLADGEVRREVVNVGRIARVYVGGLLELPVGVAAGSSWTSSGSVITVTDGAPTTTVPYSSTGSATTPGQVDLSAAGCLDVTLTEAAGPDRSTSTRTWCPGAGLARFGDGSASYTWIVAPTRSTPLDTAAFPWERSASARSGTTDLLRTGWSLLGLSFVGRPGVLPDGTIVMGLTGAGDVVALSPTATSGSKDRTLWRAHPGGVLTTCVTWGEITVATTSERRAVAYGPDGATLWSAATPDTVSQPVVVFAGRIVVASVDGTLLALDPATGHEAWRMSLPSQLDLRPVVSGDTLVAIDQNGTIVAVGPNGRQLWTSSEPVAQAYGVAAGTLVVSERGALTLRGYDLASGTKLWRTWDDGGVKTLTGLGDVVLAQTSQGVAGIDPTSGAVRWRVADALVDLLVVGDHAVYLTSGDLVALDSGGNEIARRPHGLTSQGPLSAWVILGPTTLGAITSSQLFRAVVT